LASKGLGRFVFSPQAYNSSITALLISAGSLLASS